MNAAQYWEKVDALRRVAWRENEALIVRVILDECFRVQVAVWRLTRKKDFEVFLAGRDLRNFLGAIEELRAMKVLLWEETRTGYLAAVLDPPWAIGGKRREIDKRCYDECLNGLLAHNRASDPEPTLPSQDTALPSPFEGDQSVERTILEFKHLAPPQGLADVAGVNNAGPAAERPHHQNRGSDQDAGKLQGDNRGSAPKNAVQTEAAASGQSGAATSPPPQFKHVHGNAATVPAFLCYVCGGVVADERVFTAIGEATARLFRSRFRNERELRYPGLRHLECEPPGQPWQADREDVGESSEFQKSRVLNFSTCVDPPGGEEFLHSELGSEKVLNGSTANALMQCNGDKSNAVLHCTALARAEPVLPVLSAKSRQELLEAMRFSATLLSPEEIVHALRVAGAFTRPDGGSSQKFFRDWAARKPALVRSALLDLRDFVSREGQWPENVGGYLCAFLKEVKAWGKPGHTKEKRP